MFGQKSDLTCAAAEHLQLLIAFNQSGLNIQAFHCNYSVNQIPPSCQVGMFTELCAVLSEWKGVCVCTLLYTLRGEVCFLLSVSIAPVGTGDNQSCAVSVV